LGTIVAHLGSISDASTTSLVAVAKQSRGVAVLDRLGGMIMKFVSQNFF
jgi:hypothetical protein